MSDPNRRRFIATAAATAAAAAVVPLGASAQMRIQPERINVPGGTLNVFPMGDASFILDTVVGRIAVDPVGAVATYRTVPWPDLTLITHEHPENFDPRLIEIVTRESGQVVVPPAVSELLPETQAHMVLDAGETMSWRGARIEAVPAYNTTPERQEHHPQGRGNGYVITVSGVRIYVSGDTEPTPEMLALNDINIAFLSLGLPYTMDEAQAAEAVQAFRPRRVYPYRFGAPGVTGGADLDAFAEAVGDASEVRVLTWYPQG